MSNQQPITTVDALQLGNYQIGPQRFNCTEIMTSGKEAVILRLEETATKEVYGLKVTRETYSDMHDEANEQIIADALRSVPGCTWVSSRTILTPAQHGPLLRDYPVLRNAVLMPWFNMPTWGEFKFFVANPSLSGFANYISGVTPDQINTQLIARSLARSLAALEERGLAHRDISDNNCLVDLVNSEIRLIDFEGLYTPNRQTPAFNVLGSVGYQSHSSLQSTWGKHADRFAGALLLCEMLCVSDLKGSNGSLGDAYFYQQEIDDRDTGCAHYQALVTALARIHPGLVTLFERTWRAQSTADCPALAEWYKAIDDCFPALKKSQSADSHHPGLIVFVLDHSDSMSIKTPDDEHRYDKMYDAIKKITDAMANSCFKGRYVVSPRYHVALFAYGLDCVNVLTDTAFVPSAPIAQPISANPQLGIWTIQQFKQFIESSGEFSYAHTAALLKTSTTYMTSTFKNVHTLLHTVMQHYVNCPPPYVFHITDGSNMDNGDPSAVVADIQSLSTDFGNVLVSNTFIGDPVMRMPADLKQWPGITAQTRFTPERDEIGTFLRSISSPIPATIRAELNIRHYEVEPDAVLLFPGDDHSMLHLAITTCQATVIMGPSPMPPASVAVQVPI